MNSDGIATRPDTPARRSRRIVVCALLFAAVLILVVTHNATSQHHDVAAERSSQQLEAEARRPWTPAERRELAKETGAAEATYTPWAEEVRAAAREAEAIERGEPLK
jgi:hypothetical protein